MIADSLGFAKEWRDGGATVKQVWRLFDGALVESVLMRARVIGGLPANLVGSLTGLTQGHFPVHARATYADDLVPGRRAPWSLQVLCSPGPEQQPQAKGH